MASIPEFLAAGGWQVIGLTVLAALVVFAAWIDIREHRIPNVLVLSGLVFALLLAHLPGGSIGMWFSGITVGFAMGLPFYWLRAMGAGDVKLLGMVGAFLGGSQMFGAGLMIFLAGGVLALAVVARRRAFAQLGVSLRQMALGGAVATMTTQGAIDMPHRSIGVLPYGVAIAVGTLLYLALLKGGIFQ